MSGGSVTSRAVSWPSGLTGNCTISASPGATSLTRPTSHSGGLKSQPGRRRLIWGAPAIFFEQWERAMTTTRFDDLRQYSDMLRSRHGQPVTVRFVEPRDAEALQNYFRGLTTRSRYNRFLGAMSELPATLLDHFIHVGEADRFSVIATMKIDGFETIVGEARYAFHAETSTFEF